jgi:hypothetical protein
MSAARHPAAAEQPLVLVRYVDVVLVLAALPFVLLAELPLLGYAVGAGGWIGQRALAYGLERAGRTMSPQKALGLQAAGMFARAWLLALAIIAVGLSAEREDGAMAAALVLAAFTVYFAMALITRPAHTRSRTRR